MRADPKTGATISYHHPLNMNKLKIEDKITVVFYTTGGK
jgi:hypothetical protein